MVSLKKWTMDDLDRTESRKNYRFLETKEKKQRF